MAPRRRATDQPESRRERQQVTFVAILAGVAVAAAFAAAGFALWLNSNRTTQIQEGRRSGQQITCAANAAVIDAGRSVITGHQRGKPATPPPAAVERALRKLGYPPFAVRQQRAERAGEEYGRQIAQAIESETKVKGLVKPDGTLDCQRLAAATGIQ